MVLPGPRWMEARRLEVDARIKRPRMVSARELIGKRIIGFSPNPFPDGRGTTAHNPHLYLDDGSVLIFVTEETDLGVYGVFMSRATSPDTQRTRRQ